MHENITEWWNPTLQFLHDHEDVQLIQHTKCGCGTSGQSQYIQMFPVFKESVRDYHFFLDINCASGTSSTRKQKPFGKIYDPLQLEFADLMSFPSGVVTEKPNSVNSEIRVLYFTTIYGKPPNLSLTLLPTVIELSAGRNHQKWMNCENSHSKLPILSRPLWECQSCMPQSALWNRYYTWHLIYFSRLGVRSIWWWYQKRN